MRKKSRAQSSFTISLVVLFIILISSAFFYFYKKSVNPRDFTAAVGSSQPTPSCLVSTTSWQAQAFLSQTGTFTMEYDAVAAQTTGVGYITLSNGPSTDFTNSAILIRFYSTGRIQARKGSSWTSSSVISYASGKSYHFKIVVDTKNHTYTAYVTPEGESQKTLALNYPFRTEQNAVTALSHINIISTTGTHAVCNGMITASDITAAATSPVSSTEATVAPTQTSSTSTIDPLDNFSVQGETYNIPTDGNVYKQVSGTWNKLQSIYPDPDFYSKNYLTQNNTLYRKEPGSGATFPVKKQFSDGFENATRISDYVNPTRGWTGLTLLSPLAQSVQEYVALSQCLITNTCTYKDNIIAPSNEIVHSGATSLKAYAVTPVDNMTSGEVGSKAAMNTELMHFVNGDNFWYSGWYYVKQGMPYTIFELQSTWEDKYPGMRIMIQENDGSLGYEFKWAEKPRYIQPAGSSIPFPTGKWVNVKVHFTLSNRDDGVIQLWQDGRLVIDTRGRNLPFKDAIYNFVNVGINNMRSGTPATTMFVDDIQVSNQPL